MKVGQPSSNPGQLVNGIDRLPMWCGNLVRVDEESRTAEFAHKAVHKFIVEGSSGPDYAEFHFKLEDADHHAGEICVTYLSFSDFVTTITRRSQPIKIDPTRMAHSALKNSWNLPKSISSAVITMRKGVQAETDTARIRATYNRSDDAEAINTLQVHYPFIKYASVHWISHTTRFRYRTSSTWDMWQHIITQKHGLAKIPWLNQEEPGASNSNILPWSFANRHFALIRYLGRLGKIDNAEIEGALKSFATDGDVDLASALCESSHAVRTASSHLREAAGGGDVELVKLWLSAGAEVNARAQDGETTFGRTALETASRISAIQVVELLLSAGADARLEYRTRNSALQEASGGGYVDVVERLLSTVVDVNAKPSRMGRRTALQKASEGGHIEIVERLLSAGAKVDATPCVFKQTALQLASAQGYVEIVERLLSAGAKVNAEPSEYGQTALQAALKGGYIDVIERLKTAGAHE